MSNEFTWTRYWLPSGSELVVGFDGYIAAPDSKFGRALAPNLAKLEELADVRCLVLEGEAGMGKTTVLRETAGHLRTRGLNCREVNLAEWSSESLLVQELFRDAGAGPVHLFLDSLDECPIPNISLILARELRSRTIDSLRLRIACRTGSWPAALGDSLKRIWGDDVRYLELMPLTRADARVAANSRGIDPSRFDEAVASRNAQPLAMKPITLTMLLDEFERTDALPESQLALYRMGCLALCHESSASRRDVGRVGDLGEAERLAIAARVAAVCVFTGKHLISSGKGPGELDAKVVTIQELASGFEEACGRNVPVTESAVREVLEATALVSRGAERRLNFAHRTYAEFLAARYLADRHVSLPQVKALLVHPNGTGSIVPQLAGTAAWLALMRPDVQDLVLANDPGILLNGDLGFLPPSLCERAVDAIIQSAEKGVFRGPGWGEGKRFGRLRHPGLADQLRSTIGDRSRRQDVRYLAMRIAHMCEPAGLGNDLVEVALDSTEPEELRGLAAACVTDSEPIEIRLRLLPLAAGVDDDPNDELKGAALALLWPDYVGDDPFAFFTLPKNESMSGMYHSFLYQVPDRLEPRHVLPGLAWIERTNFARPVEIALMSVATRILQEALLLLHDAAIAHTVARIVWSRIKVYDHVIDSPHDEANPLDVNPDCRRALLRAMLTERPIAEADIVSLIFSNPSLLRAEDASWLVEQLETTEGPETALWVEVISAVFDRFWMVEVTDPIIAACERNLLLAARLRTRLAAVTLHTKEAEEMRAKHLEFVRLTNPQKLEPIVPPPAERVGQCLERAESDLDFWGPLLRELSLTETSRQYGPVFKADVVTLPGWIAASPAIRQRILFVARRFVREKQPDSFDWVSTQSYPNDVIAGYKALRLLAQEDPSWVAALPTQVWAAWAAIIIAFPSSQRHAEHIALLRQAVAHCPDRVAEVAVRMAVAESASGAVTVLDDIPAPWPPEVTRAALELSLDPRMPATATKDILRSALAVGASGAAEAALQIIRANVGSVDGSPERERALAVAASLFQATPDVLWADVEALLEQDRAFCRDLMLRVASAFEVRGNMSIPKQLGVRAVATLFGWLCAEFPYSEDPKPLGVHRVEPRESISLFRSTLLSYLESCGSSEALERLRQLQAAMPELEWFPRVVANAEQCVLDVSWRPPTAAEFLALTEDPELRLIETAGDLVELLLEAFARLEIRLQGTLPQVRFLWVPLDANEWRPRDENDFSDYVAAFLIDDLSRRGIVVNREVQIRRGTGSGHPGERTDIHVSAIPTRGAPAAPVTVIVEVKGCWHSELMSAMETQLRDRYLKENQVRHGVYVVGWFHCPQWATPHRGVHASVADARALAAVLDDQAQNISRDGVSIRACVLNCALRS